MSGQNPDEMTKEELEELVTHLETENDTLKDEVRDLTNQVHQATTKKGRRNSGKEGDPGDEIEQLNEENSRLNDLLSNKEVEISELKQAKIAAETRRELLDAAKKQSDEEIVKLKKHVEELNRDIANLNKKNSSADNNTKEAKKERKQLADESRGLFKENDRLRIENDDLTSHIVALEEKVTDRDIALEKLIDELNSSKLSKENADLRVEDAERHVLELERDLKEAHEHLRLAVGKEREWEEERIKERTDNRDKLSVLQNRLVIAENDAKQSKKKVQELSVTNPTAMGEKVRQVELLTQDKAGLEADVVELKRALVQEEHEKEILAHALDGIQKEINQKVTIEVENERKKLERLKAEVSHLQQELKERDAVTGKALKEIEVLTHEKDDLLNWRQVYEDGHGLQELARSQRSLKDDKRRLGVALEQMSNKLSDAEGNIGLLKQAWDRLKRETGKEKDFMYDELQLQQEMMGENARLQAQLAEAENQTEDLERENRRVRDAMMNMAGSIGEQGFKFYGMDADALYKVNEYAKNLRDGVDKFPQDNVRTTDLRKKNMLLLQELEETKLKLETYERELSSSSSGLRPGGRQGMLSPGSTSASASNLYNAAGSGGGLSKEQENDMKILRGKVEDLLKVNEALHHRFTTVESRIGNIVQSAEGGVSITGGGVGAENAGGHDERVAAVLVNTNEMLMKELNDLKAMMAAGVDPHRELIMGTAPGTVGFARMGAKLPPAGGRVQYKGGVSLDSPRVTTGSADSTSLFTPMVPGGLRTSSYTPLQMTAGSGIGGYMTGGIAGGAMHPVTPHGKTLLNKTLAQMNLPPEEWAEEVKDLNGQLVECLEQLFEREQELDEQRGVVAALEENLVFIKQQMAVVYQDFAVRVDDWDKKEKLLGEENHALRKEKDDAQFKLNRINQLFDATKDQGELQSEVVRLGRKCVGFEVRELMGDREKVAISEQLLQEQIARRNMEVDFVEMETSLKKRILYLEQYKAAVSSKMGRLQGRLDTSVPNEDYQSLQIELECLRDDHLVTLRREVEARIASLRSLEQAHELRNLYMKNTDLETRLAKAEHALQLQERDMIHQHEATKQALAKANSSSELSDIISEMARCKGEASRMAVEADGYKRRSDLLEGRYKAVEKDMMVMSARVAELEERQEASAAAQSEATRRVAAVELRYLGGLNGEEARELKNVLDKAKRESEEAQRDAVRFKELCEVASQQAQTMGTFKQQHLEELNELREYATKLEARGDDELLIGKLQRQLMSTKASYKSFVNKYNGLRKDVRTKELALRVLETRLDEREAAVLKIQESHRLEIAALKKAIRSIHNMAADESGATNGNSVAGGTGLGKKSKKGKSQGGLVTIGEKLSNMSDKVHSLAGLAEGAVRKASEAEDEARQARDEKDVLATHLELAQQQLSDLEALRKGTSKQQAVAARLVALSEEVRTHKLATLQQRREIHILRQEKKHLQGVLARMEADMEDLEEGKVFAETKHLLADMPSSSSSSSNAKGQHEGFGKGGGGMESTMDAYKRIRGDLLSFDVENDDDDGDGDHGFGEKKSGQGHKKSDAGGIGGSGKGKPLYISTSDLAPYDEHAADASDPEALVRLLQQRQAELHHIEAHLSTEKQRADKLSNQLVEREASLREYEEQILQYEDLLHNEGLPSLQGRTSNKGYAAGGNNPNRGARGGGRHMTIMQEEQQKLQEAAQATIKNLSQLIEEKNHQIERLREKVEDLQAERRPKSAADKKADDLLMRLDMDDQGVNASRKRGKSGSDHDSSADGKAMHTAQTKLLGQLEEAERIMMDRDQTIKQLEQRLETQRNQGERAEARCGAALTEMEAMKNDMIMLAQQLSLSEERLSQAQALSRGRHTVLATPAPPIRVNASFAAPPTTVHAPSQSQGLHTSYVAEAKEAKSGGMEDLPLNAQVEKKLSELRSAVKSKDEKVKSYRSIIIKLKEEFIKLEEDRAMAMAAGKSSSKHHGSRGGDGQGPSSPRSPRDQGSSGVNINAGEMKEMKDQIAVLRDGLREARDNLEKAKKTQEKLHQAKQLAQDETERLESLVGRAEAQAAAAQESLARARKELEETRKREVRLRDKLKEFLDTENGGGKLRDLKETTARLEQLERECDVLRAQNLALRKAAVTGDMKAVAGSSSMFSSGPAGGIENASTQNAQAVTGPSGHAAAGRYGPTGTGAGGRTMGGGTGNVLGGGEGPPGDDGVRSHLHGKWEADKKMQGRVTTLEKRLKEKMEEMEDMSAQLKKAREIAQNSLTAKEEMTKKMQAMAKTHAASSSSSAMDGHKDGKKASLEDVVGLEAAQARVFMLEDENQAMRRRVEVDLPNEIANLRHQLSVSRGREDELAAELEELQARAKRAEGSVNGPKASLRESEDRFMRDERLRDDLERSRKQRLDLEAALLDRDSRAMEIKFDLEAKTQDVERLRRRCKELESAYRTISSSTGVSGMRGGTLGSPSRAGGGRTAWAEDDDKSGSRFKREKDLEGVVEAMKKVVDKLTAENSRLRKGVGVGSPSPGEATGGRRDGGAGAGTSSGGEVEKRLAAEKKKCEKLEEEIKTMQAQLRSYADSGSKLKEKQNQIVSFRKQLASKEEEIKALKEGSDTLAAERDSFKRKATASEGHVLQLEVSLQQARKGTTGQGTAAATGGNVAGGGPGQGQSSSSQRGPSPTLPRDRAESDRLERELQEVRSREAMLMDTRDSLQNKVNDLQKQLQQALSGAGGGGVMGSESNSEVRRLRDENERLRQELSAFDLDFFEEIENLKYAHAEALKKLRVYERTAMREGRGDSRSTSRER